MNCDQLQTFQMVVAKGTFTGAGRELLLSQSAVSQQIQALEASLRVRLFDRTGNKIHLTREGQVLLEKTEVIISALQEIKVLFENLSNLESGRVDIGSSAVFGTYFLAKLLARFSVEHPSIEVDLHAGNSHDIISKLLSGKVEFGFGGLYEDEPRIGFTLIHAEPLVAVVEASHPLATKEVLTPEDLTETNLVLREKGTRIRDDMDTWLSKIDPAFMPKRYVELDNIDIVKKLIGEGFGMTILPRIAVKNQLDSKEFKELALPTFDLNAYYYLYYPRDRKISHAALEFLKLMRATAPLSHGANLDLLDFA